MAQLAEAFKDLGLVGSNVTWNTDLGPSEPESIEMMLGRDVNGELVWGFKDNKADTDRVVEVIIIEKKGQIVWRKL
jgi:hypothetical protein